MKRSSAERVMTAAAIMAAMFLLMAGPAQAVWPPDWLGTMLGAHIKALDLVDSLHTTVLAARTAERGAVMAETDEESEELAAEARRDAEGVERQARALRAILDQLGWSKEKGLLDEFDRSWQDSRKLDEEILSLAVQNTNLKAARLSQTKGIALLRRLARDLKTVREAAGENRPCAHVADSACRVLEGALMIQILHAPHIAEADPGRMDEVEQEMRQYDAEVRSALEELGNSAGADVADKVRAAKETYNEYASLTQDVVACSRQNTNVLSLSLSMGQKRKVTARCLEILQSMQDLLRKHEFGGSR